MKTKLTALTIAAIFATRNLAVADEPPKPSLVVECVVAAGALAGGIWIAYKLKKFCDKNLPKTEPPPPAATNSPPASTSGRLNRQLLNIPVTEELYDIAGSGYQAPDGSTYSRLLVLSVETSTDLIHWQTFTVTGYVSPAFVLLARGTNVSLQANNGDWAMDFGFEDDGCRYFR